MSLLTGCLSNAPMSCSPCLLLNLCPRHSTPQDRLKAPLRPASVEFFVGDLGPMMTASCIKLIKVVIGRWCLCPLSSMLDERGRYVSFHFWISDVPSCSFPLLLEGSTKDKSPWIESNRKLLSSNDL